MLDINNFVPGTLLTIKALHIGVFTNISVVKNRLIWNPYDEKSVNGNILILNTFEKWENAQGYKILSNIGHSWLIWSEKSGFAENPDNYLAFVE